MLGAQQVTVASSKVSYFNMKLSHFSLKLDKIFLWCEETKTSNTMVLWRTPKQSTDAAKTHIHITINKKKQVPMIENQKHSDQGAW